MFLAAFALVATPLLAFLAVLLGHRLTRTSAREIDRWHTRRTRRSTIMTNAETPERFAVRVMAARISMKAGRLLVEPSPDWIVALVEEGERRERARREADTSAR